MPRKRCTRCKKIKTLDNYALRSALYGGYQSTCKLCHEVRRYPHLYKVNKRSGKVSRINKYDRPTWISGVAKYKVDGQETRRLVMDSIINMLLSLGGEDACQKTGTKDVPGAVNQSQPQSSSSTDEQETDCNPGAKPAV